MTCTRNHCEWRDINGLCLWPRGCPRRMQAAVVDLRTKRRRVITGTDGERTKTRREKREAELRDHRG